MANSLLDSDQKITLGGIRNVFIKFFQDPDIKNVNPQEVSDKLWRLLIEESHNSPNSNDVKPEMLELHNCNVLKNPPGEANPITNQSAEESEQKEQKPNEPENPLKNIKEENEKEPKESKEKVFKEKEKELKEKEKELKDLKEKYNKLNKSMEKLNNDHNKSMEKLNNDYNKSMEKLNNDYSKSMEKLNNDCSKRVYEIETKLKENENGYKQVLIELNNELIKVKNENNYWKENCSQLEEQLKNKRKDYSELYKKNEELKHEASQYQSALGDARNYRLGDNDVNNPTQLSKEIEIIQDKINDFCKIKGGVEINEANLAKLLSDFKCKYDPTDKVLPKAALQHYIISTILTKTDEYIATKGTNENSITNKYFELEILNSTKSYLDSVKALIKLRNGTDEVSSAAPKKIQQLVYAVLGDRGFGLSNDKREHEFVQELKDEILSFMSQFRTIKKAEKRKENEDMIADIIRNVIKMFIFRIKVLEPPAEIHWIPKDTKVDPTLMEARNLEDENYDDWVVNLCSFPLICVNFNSETERKVLVHAKIMAVKAEQKSFVGFNKMKSMFSSSKSEANDSGRPPKKNSMDSQSQPPHNITKN